MFTGVSEFQFPNSEFRMAYGRFGIPHHMVGDRGGAGAGGRGRARADVTGSDMGCRTLECYVNSLVGHGVSYGGG